MTDKLTYLPNNVIDDTQVNRLCRLKFLGCCENWWKKYDVTKKISQMRGRYWPMAAMVVASRLGLPAEVSHRKKTIQLPGFQFVLKIRGEGGF